MALSQTANKDLLKHVLHVQGLDPYYILTPSLDSALEEYHLSNALKSP